MLFLSTSAAWQENIPIALLQCQECTGVVLESRKHYLLASLSIAADILNHYFKVLKTCLQALGGFMSCFSKSE